MDLRADTATRSSPLRPSSWRPRGAVAAVLVSLAALGALAGRAAADPEDDALEYRVKAAFLFKFAHFIDWPAEAFPAADSPFRIGVLGTDPFGDVLEKTVAGKTARGRSFEVKRSARLEDLEDCHILFVGRSERARARRIVEALRNTAVVTVSDLDLFAEQGGLFGFVIVEGKVRLKLNLDVEEASGLEVSSQLKRICIPVRTTTGAPR